MGKTNMTIIARIVFALFIIMLAISFISAAMPQPHAFEGKIISKDGTLTNMRTLIAKIDGTVTASTKIQGDSYKITVVDNTGKGGAITFYIGDEIAKEAFEFKTFEITKTDLTFDTIPIETIGSCGDGICAVEECSFCAIDCSVTQCKTNGVCDASIGEDLITAENDCSVCGDGQCTGDETQSTCSTDCGSPPTTTTTTTSSGGGGGGGGSSSSQQTASSDKEKTVSSAAPITMSIETLNEEINEPVEEFNSNKITGFAIFDISNGGSWKVLIIAFLGLCGYFFYKKKFGKKKNTAVKKY